MWMVVLSGLLFADPDTEPKIEVPKGSPPIVLTARVEKDQLVSVKLTTSYQVQLVTTTETIGGKSVPVSRNITVPVMTEHRQTWELKKATVTDGEGKKIDLATLRKRLGRNAPVVISADGKPIDKAYLDLLQKSAIVIVAKKSAVPVLPAVAPKRPVPVPIAPRPKR